MTAPIQPKVVLITGGGTGIGRAAAVLFAERGWQVVISGRRAAPLAEVADRHTGIRYHSADVSDADQAEELITQTIEHGGRLDALVNNAGIFTPMTVETATPADMAELFQTNVFAPSQLLRAAIPHLRAVGGAVVNVTSATAQRPQIPGGAFYGASKAALDHLTKSWAAELAPANIRVNAVAPGPTDTPIQDAAGSPDDVERSKKFQAGMLPLRRMGDPAEVARWIYLLAEPASSWVTGQIIAVDGGMTIA
jgi:NAD(P)-dependent dehydrogenase (short-subunit alcohol dehydrogenase family)